MEIEISSVKSCVSLADFMEKDTKIEISSIKDIEKYNPYVDLAKFMDDEYFEAGFLKYFEDFKNAVNAFKASVSDVSSREVDQYFAKIVRKRNNLALHSLLEYHRKTVGCELKAVNEENVVKLKNRVRVVKNMILAVEPADMNRLLKVDLKVGKAIDFVSNALGITDYMSPNKYEITELLQKCKSLPVGVSFTPVDRGSFCAFSEYVKKTSGELCEFYRRNFSLKTAERYIKLLTFQVNKLLDGKAMSEYLDLVEEDKKLIDELVQKHESVQLTSVSFKDFTKEFQSEIEAMKKGFVARYSDGLARKLSDELDSKAENVIHKKAVSVGYEKKHKNILQDIFASYNPGLLISFCSEISKLDDSQFKGLQLIFYKAQLEQLQLYFSEEELIKIVSTYRNLVRKVERTKIEKSCTVGTGKEESVFTLRMYDEYDQALAEKQLFEMKLYERYVRIFKGKIRELTKDIRGCYSSEYANKLVATINKKADAVIQDGARGLGKPVPKNPWFVRKYLWADPENFLTENGVKFRKKINPALREVVKVAMKNQLVIEERPKLDSTKQYIFVPTHYFTEDIIGKFASMDRHACMVMGTTDQIENNPLLLAALLFGLIYVDRLDSVNRKECVEKQNRTISYGTNVINYISGSWENSEDELQPRSYSGPYRTSCAKDVEIVPVGLYLSREEKKIYVRYGDPLDLRSVDEETANNIIRDTLASIHFKQIQKHSTPIETIEIAGYGVTHNLPWDQHTDYMKQIAQEYWGQPWSKPFAWEEIGVRPSKDVSESDVYGFVENLSKDQLLKLSAILKDALILRDRSQRYDIVRYIDTNYKKHRVKFGKGRKVS